MFAKKTLLTCVSLLALVALLAACGATPAPQVVKETVPVEVTKEVTKEVTVVETVPVEVTKVVQATVETVVTATPAPQPAEAQARAETLNIAINNPIPDPTNLNLYAPGVSRSNTGLHQLIYEYFFYQNLETGEYIPWLAEDYEYNADYTTITVYLRSGVKWNDGEPFTPDDVVFTYNTLLANPGMTWASEVSARVKSVEKVDDLTVRFNLTAPNPRFHLIREAFPGVGIWGGVTILPQHIWEGQDPLTFKGSDPVGTGPYRLAKATQNAMTYERREDWWGTEVFGVTPAPKTINFEYVGPSTSVALALAADDLDSPNIGILSLGDFLAVASRNPNLSAWHKEAPYAWLDPCPRPLMVQNANPPWDQKEARWALSYLIDRQQIVDLAYEGTTVPSWGIWPYYGGLQPYFDAIQDLRDQYPTTALDPAKAEELFGAVGYTKGADGKYTSASGEPLKLTYVVNAASIEEMKVSAVLADQLDAQGIEVEVRALTDPALADAVLRGEYDIKLHSFCPGTIFDNLDLFNSKFYVPLGEPAPWYERNSFRYKNPDFDAVVNQMAQTPDEDLATMTDLFHQAMAIWFEDLPVIPVVQAPALVPFTTTYWEGWPNADNPWNMPVSWWATFDLVITGYPSPVTGEWVGGIRPAGGP
jgi:peptide/nickel transport system substrate-binding protein